MPGKKGIEPLTFTTFGDLLRYLRERANMTQRELAHRVGYHYSYLSRLEKNVRTPNEFILRTRFAPALRIENDQAWVERLVELATQGLIPQPASTTSETNPPGRRSWQANWPASLTPLLGRESESQALFKILLSEEVRLVTLIGPPGVGKTRLSLHIAEQLAPHFSNGVVFVDLMPVLDPEQVIPALAAVLGTQETLESSIFESVKSSLHDQQLLIVMDNFEQVLGAAPQLIPLLAAAPDVKMIVTSREALRLRGEQEFPLAPLAVPNEKNASVLDYPSVQLFVQRARAANPDFQLDESDALRVAEICRRLDGLPLAIELAAARIRSFSPADMLEQFERRFQWLAATARDIPEWRRTLWSAIAWSYNLLNEKERTLFERLSVFAGGWMIEAAEAVCSDETIPRSEILPMLMQMADKSLVFLEADARFRFLDTIKKFAHENLIEHGGLQEASNRHLRYFADWAEELDASFNKLSALEFRARTGLEQSNIRAALDWALHHEPAFLDGLRLSIPANLIWLEHGQIRDEYERAQAFLRRETDASTSKLHARLLLRTSALAIRIGQNSIGYEYCLKAERIARSLNDPSLTAATLLALGDMERDHDQFDIAEMHLNEALSIYRELGALTELNRCLTSLGNNLYHQKCRTESESALQEALAIAERANDRIGLVYALQTQAGILRYDGKYIESMEKFQRALDAARINGDRPNAGIHLVNLGILSNMLGDYHASQEYSAEAIAIFQSLGDEDQQAFPKRMLAYALLQQGFPTQAHALALESLYANLAGGTGVFNCLTALAEIKLLEDDIVPVAKLYGFLKPRVQEKYSGPSPDSRSFERIGHALEEMNTECWQAEGNALVLEEAVAIASQWTLRGSAIAKRKTPSKQKRSRR